MLNIIKPLHIACNQQVLEQNNQFHCVVSATMGVRLSSGEALLEFDFYKEAFAFMGENPIPDMAMPKPQAEYIVSGSYFAPDKQEVSCGEVKVKIGDKEKSLLVFGSRQWEMGVPTKPEPFSSVPLTYAHAFGGNGLDSNLDGIGYEDLNLPLIENPNDLLTSNNQKIQPAGLSPLFPSWSQRAQYQGTYDEKYLKECFPGYPKNFDWRFFMTTMQDQWLDGFFTGNEEFELHNLHPDKPLIKGVLPAYKVCCFLQKKSNGIKKFDELKLNLDTVWFFPETNLALLIWRGGVEVADDEATAISDIILGYESASDTVRTEDHYQAALQKRIDSEDSLLNNFNTSDLIPTGAKCAMELLQENTVINTESDPFSDNLDAKTKAVQAVVDEKVKDFTEHYDEGLKGAGDVPNKEQIKLKEMLEKPVDIKPDPEIIELNKKLEAILPGITAGDAKKINLKEFSFDKIDEILAVIDKFREGKQDQAAEEVKKAHKLIEVQLAAEAKTMEQVDSAEIEKIDALLARLHDAPAEQEAIMPRMNLDEIQDGLAQLSPELTESMQQLQTMKSMDSANEDVAEIEKSISQMLQQQDEAMVSSLKTAENDFKELYRSTAHAMPQCVSPHSGSVEEIKEKFIDRIRKQEVVANMDWACLDMSGMVLDGVDFSGAYLEQVNFSNASLKGCDFTGAILTRAILDNADFSNAILEDANLGKVTANNTNFNNLHFKGTTLSKSDFTNASFVSSCFEDVEILDIKLNGAEFTGCKLEKLLFIDASFKNACFKKASLNDAMFMNCDIESTDYSNAIMQKCVWSNTRLKNVIFDHADMTSNCFVVTETESIVLESVSFEGSRLEKSNFQGISMPKANFSNAILTNANFSFADVSYANFTNADAGQVMFRKALLTHSKFDNANVMESSMSKAHLSGASFYGANLYAVDFLRSTMGGTDFSGANLDNTIIRDWQPS